MDPALISYILAIFLLLVLSGFFSGSETALTAASRPRMHYLEGEGDHRATLVLALGERKERLIGAILMGNNLVNILASALATSLLMQTVGDAAVPIATVVMTLLILIFAEVLPKTYAITHPDRAALTVAPLIRPVVWLLSPATQAIQTIVAATLTLFGLGRPRPDGVSAEDELRGAIEMHARDGTMVKMDRDMLGSILDLDEVDVSEIMVHRSNMQMISIDLPPAEVVAQALDSPYTRIPLWRDEPENIVGVLHAKDLLRALHGAEGRVEEIDIAAIATEPWFVPETTALDEQLNAFRRRHAHFALVVDEYGDLMGLVTLEDILEEIVGDISDEHDVVVAGVRPQPNGDYVVDGTVTIRDLNRRFDWSLPDEEAATVAGLVIHEARVIPEVGQVFRFHGFTFEILRRKRNQVTAIRLTPPPEPAEPGERT